MAAAPEHWGGLLTRRRLLLLAAVVLACGAALLWVSQAGVLRRGVNFYFGKTVRISGSRGTLASGFTLYGLTLKTPALEGAIPEIFVKPDLMSAFSGHPSVEVVIITSPSLTAIMPGSAGGGKKAGASAGLPAGLPEIQSARLTGGSLRLGPDGASVTGINCGFSYKAGIFRARDCGGSYAGARTVFSGEYSEKTAAAGGRFYYPARQTTLDYKYRLTGERHSLSARGSAAGAPVKLTAEAAGSDWAASLNFERFLPLGLIKPGLAGFPLRAAGISASGRGYAAGLMRAKGKFSAEKKDGAASGTFSLYPGGASLAALGSLNEFSVSGTAGLSGEKLSGAWKFSAGDGTIFPPGGSLVLNGFSGHAALSGTTKAPRLSGAAELAGLRDKTLTAGPVKLDFEGVGGAKEKFALKLSVLDPAVGARRADYLRAEARGSRAAHSFSAAFSSLGSTITLAGTASLLDGAWKAVVDAVDLADTGWSLCGPFFTSASAAGGVSVSGFCLSSGHSRFNFSGVFLSPFPQELHASLSGLALAQLERFGPAGVKPEGLVNARADYPLGGPGSFDFSATGLKLNGLEMGAASASGVFRPGALHLKAGDWKIYGGSVISSGSLVSEGGKVSAAFSVKASTMNISPLLVFAPGLAAREIWLNGESVVSLADGKFKSTGGLSLDSPKFTVAALGLTLNDVKAEVSSRDLSSARLKLTAVRKGGMLKAEGEISNTGPEIKIQSSGLPFSHPTGLSGKVGASLLFAGTWRSPELKGLLDLDEARFEMEKFNKYRSSPERSGFYESMDVDLGIKARKNAWYREGSSSIELKADLLFQKTPYRSPTLLGTIEALKGYYVYLGNTFTINSGLLSFTGEYPPNPVIAAEASNEERGRPYKVYFTAFGTLRVPKIQLTSDPSMEQRDIISYLVTGRPLYELYAPGHSGTQPGQDNTAQNFAADYIAQKAASTIGRKLSIDMINLKMNSERQGDLTVGRYIIKDLFISYGQVLGPGGEKRVSAEYTLTKFLSLVGKNSSEGGYFTDLLFKFGIR